MDRFLINDRIAAHLCIAEGLPNPDTEAEAFITAITNNVAVQIERKGLDLDEARMIIGVAIERTLNPCPDRPLSPIEAGIINDLAA